MPQKFKYFDHFGVLSDIQATSEVLGYVVILEFQWHFGHFEGFRGIRSIRYSRLFWSFWCLQRYFGHLQVVLVLLENWGHFLHFEAFRDVLVVLKIYGYSTFFCGAFGAIFVLFEELKLCWSFYKFGSIFGLLNIFQLFFNFWDIVFILEILGYFNKFSVVLEVFQ